MLRIEIETENAAFDDEPASEAARILRDLASRLEREGVGEESHGREFKLSDINGNRVGFARVDEN